jgi:hypothetical protein
MKLLDHVLTPDGRLGVVVALHPTLCDVRLPAPHPDWPWCVVESLPRQHLQQVEVVYEEAPW